MDFVCGVTFEIGELSIKYAVCFNICAYRGLLVYLSLKGWLMPKTKSAV